ncbi:hypothetical protein AB9K35_17425 [Leisingera sp. XS_AS12]|uniref:hypothetical protein n=1 Tax=Leisingera sp. XS_AS12 TaxID=3241294 RepID=UPI0035158039
MDTILFAADAANTPISKLKQAAKRHAKESGIQLAAALDLQAEKLGYQRWDEVISNAWTLSPAGSPQNAHADYHLMHGHCAGGPLLIGFPAEEVRSANKLPEFASLHRVKGKGRSEHTLVFYEICQLGRKLNLTEKDRDELQPGKPLQAQAQTFLRLALQNMPNLPVLIGFAPKDEREEGDASGPGSTRPEVLTVKDAILLAAEIPGSKDRFEIEVPIATAADEIRDRFKSDETSHLFGFRLQKNGSLLLRRARVIDEDDAWNRLATAAKMIALLNWTGLYHPSGRAKYKADRDASQITTSGMGQEFNSRPYDHHHILVDRKSGQTVVLNQPYTGNSGIAEFGLLNMLNAQSITKEAPEFAGLQWGGRTLFHALDAGDVDLEAIAHGAMTAARMVREADLKRVSPQKTTVRKKASTRRGIWITPIENLTVDLSNVPQEDRYLLSDTLPDIKKLKTPYWKNKMRAFQQAEHLSWDIQNRYNSTGVSIDEVVAAIRKCPLDADLWGFLDIFDIHEAAKLEIFRRGVAAGELYLGDSMINDAGYFWGVLHTRPYMRCMNHLYRLLVKMERPAEAVPIGRKMLELCPNDNIGIRLTIETVEAAITDRELAEDLARVFTNEDLRDD